MDRSSLVRLILIGGAVALFVLFGLPKLTGSDGPKTRPIPDDAAMIAPGRGAEELCEIAGERFKAVMSTQSATLRHLYLDGAKYTVDGRAGGEPMDLVTTPKFEGKSPLRFDFRAPGADSQVPYDLFDWKLEAKDGKSCTFTARNEKVALRNVTRANGKPFELETEVTIENVSDAPAKHRAAVETSTWRYERDVKGGFGRQSPFTTQVECGHDGKLEDKGKSDFSPKDFTKPEYKNGWFTQAGKVDFASVTNFYFAQAVVPLEGPNAPGCELQVDERNDGLDDKVSLSGAFYRSRLAWAPKDLAPGEKATYKVLHFAGPKEREVLAEAAGGQHSLSNLIKLGMFAFIGKILVGFLVKAHGVIGSWGASIIVLTVTVRTVLFPLTWKTIKNGAQMRKLKPELDVINKKYAEDAQQKQLATMELYRKHGMNPLAMFGGCLPTLAQMPVWFALYTSLQTAAELYHTPFLWFRDLSAPDTIHVMGFDLPFILPILLGSTTFIQQKIMPAQMDAAQQKMMTYMMPAIFTAMMLFLPSGLGVYMFTNSLLGIVQQLAVEKYYGSQKGGGDKGITVREKDSPTSEGETKGDKKGTALTLGKGKASV